VTTCFTSRTIHPFVGWILGWNQAIWLIFFWIGFNAWALCQFHPTAADTPDPGPDAG
jgi:hypothetical protein